MATRTDQRLPSVGPKAAESAYIHSHGEMNTVPVLTSMSRNAGGLQQSVRRLHQSLNQLPGIKVSVAALLDEYSMQDLDQWKPLPVSLSPVFGPRAFGFSPSLVQKLFDLDADILQTHGIWTYPSMAVSRWHQRTGNPYLISPHGMLDSWAVRNSALKKRIAFTVYERRHLEHASSFELYAKRRRELSVTLGCAIRSALFRMQLTCQTSGPGGRESRAILRGFVVFCGPSRTPDEKFCFI
jgi:hypothetical protein